MTIGTLLLILMSVCLSALAQISFKLGVGGAIPIKASSAGTVPFVLYVILQPGVMGGLALYGLGTLAWLAVLRRVDVSQAYPFIGLGIAITSILACLVFGEALGLQKIIGTVLIIGGIVVVAWS
ncbi:MAG TPA: EamA family transporter [Acetobacteraceae bacterium]|jgi:multidrug transporter EmrE-like cation transporter|nr:EamA family transporter [Acetobacteraceae bacterium]HUB47622.1 EamA family transporter [Acetobacteraceae bacterium]